MVFQNRTRWMIRFDSCGHVKVLGYTRPTEELEQKGLLNAPAEGDPYADQVDAHRREVTSRETRERADSERHRAARTVKDRYFLWDLYT